MKQFDIYKAYQIDEVIKIDLCIIKLGFDSYNLSKQKTLFNKEKFYTISNALMGHGYYIPWLGI